MNQLLKIAIRIGIVSRRHDGTIKYPIYCSPWRTWKVNFWHEPWIGMFRNRADYIKYVEGRLLPWRWGIRIVGLEIGDRGSHHAPQDMKRSQ